MSLEEPRKKRARHSTAESKRERRATARQKSLNDLPVVPGRTPAEVMVVQAGTRNAYMFLLAALVSFMCGLSSRALVPHSSMPRERAMFFLYNLNDDEVLGDALAHFVNAGYWQGE
jgi:hypothetical protein